MMPSSIEADAFNDSQNAFSLLLELSFSGSHRRATLKAFGK